MALFKERLVALIQMHAALHSLEFAGYYADGEYHAVLRREGHPERDLGSADAEMRASSADESEALVALLELTMSNAPPRRRWL